LRVAIAAGGTGGHIMPALALAEALGNIGHPVKMEFFCGNRPVERRIYAEAGVTPVVLPVASVMVRGFWRRAMLYARLATSFLIALWHMRRGGVAVSMGGYVAAPVLAAAWILRRPIVLHDSNTILGKVHRVMAKRARFIACGLPLVAAPEGVRPARVVETGTPVRLAITRGNRDEAAASMYLKTHAFTIFINGGSLGASGLNHLMAQAMGRLSHLWTLDFPLQVIWSTGADKVQEVREALQKEELKGQFWITPSVERMEHAYALADLVIGRAGGSSLAEILQCGKPAILFPLPHGAEQHQHHNAAVLNHHGAALVFDEETVAPELVAREIFDLAETPETLKGMAKAARELGRPSASRDVARLVVEAGTGKTIL
jgi:UDP-N-acetylglucosamine--N-acetylmuramyl-(pentapeptide) pyrophosphoryl-undecaprenol N-acetylglucosamine transferase